MLGLFLNNFIMIIGHISDLHLNTFFSKNNLNKIYLLFDFLSALPLDHLVITGDLTDNAGKDDFLILRKLFQDYNILNSERLSITVGNHDIFGGVQTADDIFNFPDKCRRTDYQKNVREFYDYFPETFQSCCYINEKNIFPYGKIIDNVLFIGANSVAEYSNLNNPFASNGLISIPQFNEIVHILDQFGNQVEHRIILMHHHFNKIKLDKNKKESAIYQRIEKQTMKLKKKKRLYTLFNKYDVSMVLHGHYHESIEYTRKGIRFLNSSAGFKSVNEDGFSFHVLDTNDKQINVKKYDFYQKDKALNNKEVILNEAVAANVELIAAHL
jgi:3',5'-cyclic-AMP phosphodiesterase